MALSTTLTQFIPEITTFNHITMAGQVRQPFDELAFEKYLSEHVPEIVPPVDVKQFNFGQSNPTYLITAANGRKFVMRKRPPGKVPRQSHRVEREYEILRALETTSIPVPKPYALCTDESVIGTMFYIMEFLDGRIFEDQNLPGVSLEEKGELWRAAIQTLAELHSVDPREVGLENFGKAAGFYNRQIRTWESIIKSQEGVLNVDTQEPVGKLPNCEESLRYFKDQRLQPKERISLVHGDYKLDNLVFHKTEPRVIGILDWESSTVGHPLSDVCNLVSPFYLARQPGATPYDLSTLLPGRTPGLPQPELLVEWYTWSSSYDPRRDLSWGVAFNVFKLAAICQGVAARVALGQTASREAHKYASMKGPVARLAWNLVLEANPTKSARL